jgi:DNA-binding response OmpR family regulator
MTNVLLATDADWIYDDVAAALARPGTTVSRVHAGVEVGPTVAELTPELVILDLQIGNMGGAATCRHLRLEAGAGRLPATKILMLLDREVDIWLSVHAGADAHLVKPLDSVKLRRAMLGLLAAEAV